MNEANQINWMNGVNRLNTVNGVVRVNEATKFSSKDYPHKLFVVINAVGNMASETTFDHWKVFFSCVKSEEKCPIFM